MTAKKLPVRTLRGHCTSKEQNHPVQNSCYIGFIFKMCVKCITISEIGGIQLLHYMPQCLDIVAEVL